MNTASTAAIDDAETDGTNADQYPDHAKYTVHPALPTLVNAAHAHDTPSVAPSRMVLRSWGTNCGIAHAAAARGTTSKMFIVTFRTPGARASTSSLSHITPKMVANLGSDQGVVQHLCAWMTSTATSLLNCSVMVG